MTSSLPQAVFFDVDGVLLDSLRPHLEFCAQKALDYQAQGPDDQPLVMPDAHGFKRLIGDGVSVSPMLNFFRAVGFVEELAQRGVMDYERDFMASHAPLAFDGIARMLGRLHHEGVIIGLVTANTQGNVAPALGEVLPLFDEQGLFYVDGPFGGKGKAACLNEAVRRLDLDVSRCVYVGDQPSDAAAAQAAGWTFVGVTYGWGFQGADHPVPLVPHVEGIADHVLPSTAVIPATETSPSTRRRARP